MGVVQLEKIVEIMMKKTNRNGCKMKIMEVFIGKTGRMQDVKWEYHGDV